MKSRENFIFIDDYYKIEFPKKEKSITIFSPFYPFSNKFIYNLFSKTKFNEHTMIFSNIETLNGSHNFAYNFINIMDVYCKSIEKIDAEHIYLIGFGIFSNIFVNLGNIFKAKIEKIILFEPDFSNNALIRKNSSSYIFSNLNLFLNFYLEEKFKIDKNLISKNYSKYLKKIFNNMRELYFNNKLLKDLLDNRIDTIIFWKVMEKELWPLPQILVEDYGIKAFSLNSNIYKVFVENNKEIIDILNSILE